MTRDELRERLPVIQAWCEGRRVQWQSDCNNRWEDWDDANMAPAFMSYHYTWRIAPTPPPPPRTWWLCGECLGTHETWEAAAGCHAHWPWPQPCPAKPPVQVQEVRE